MTTPTYEFIASATIPSPVNTVTISSIPNTYRDLIVVADIKLLSGTTGMTWRLNNDSGSYYFSNILEAYFSTKQAVSSASGGEFLSWWNKANADSTYRSTHILEIMEYSQTDKWKVMLLRGGVAPDTYQDAQVGASVNMYKRTTAINSVTVFPSSGNSFTTDTTISIYGVAA